MAPDNANGPHEEEAASDTPQRTRRVPRKPKSGPYRTGAPAYLELGWLNPIPVRKVSGRDGKAPAIDGVVSNKHPDLTVDRIRELVDSHGDSRIGLWLQDGVIGLDVDAYDGRVGAETIGHAEAALGLQPPTWTTTSRGPGQPSGIRLYRVPLGRTWRDAQANLEAAHGEHVDIVHRGHRHAMVAPSMHPDTGKPYLWYRPDGTLSQVGPRPEELAELPDAWVEFLTAPRRSSAPTASVEFEEGVQESREGPPDGVIPASTRHNTLTRYIGRWRARGLTLAEAELLLRHHWARCEQPAGEEFTWEEARDLLVDEFDRYDPGPWHQEPSPADAPIDESGPPSPTSVAGVERVQTIDEFLSEEEPEYDWLIPGLLERGDRLGLTGPEGGGKSTLQRQVGVQSANGTHPFTLEPIEPIRVLVIDLENGRAHVRREFGKIHAKVAGTLDPAMLGVIVEPGGIDLLGHPPDEGWLLRQCDAFKPDLLVIGPAYKMASEGKTPAASARAIQTTLDKIRSTFNAAILVEMHTGHGTEGRRPTRPIGASEWLRWPEFGFHLAKGGTLTHWRIARDERDWPGALKRGGQWPWTVETRPVEETWSRIVAVVHKRQHTPSERTLAELLSLSKTAVHRAIDAHRAEWEGMRNAYGDE